MVEHITSEDKSERVNIRPGVGLYALFPSLRYSSWIALGELVDNSIQSYLNHKRELFALHGPNYRLRVDINFTGGENPTIKIEDNAAGIYPEDIGRAFTPAMPPLDKSGINQYGIGMKSSACWYSKFFTIRTQALNDMVIRTVTFDIGKIVKNEIYDLELNTEKVVNPKLHGTRIIMRDLNQPLPIAGNAARVRNYLKSMYRDFLKTGELILNINNEQLKADTIEYLNAPYWPTDAGPNDGKAIDWVKSFEIELNESFVETEENKTPPRIRGTIGILKEGRTKQAGLALVWRRKVVQGAGNMADSPDDLYRPAILFGSSNDFRKQRIIGELDVSELRVTSFKDAIVWASGQEEEALKKIQIELNKDPYPLLKMATRYRATRNTKDALDQIQQTLEEVVTTTTKSILDSVAGAIGSNLPDLTVTESEPPISTDASKSIQRTMILVPNFEKNIILELRDQQDDMQWLRVREDNSRKMWIMTVNRAHPFMQSFTIADPDALEPVLRLALAIGFAEIQGLGAGYESAGYMRLTINEYLRNYLSSRSDVEIEYGEA
jgi:hypothetical protein